MGVESRGQVVLSVDDVSRETAARAVLVQALAETLSAHATRRSDVGGARDEPIECTVFAPPAVRAGDHFLVQVFIHDIRQATAARQLALEFDDTTGRRGFMPLYVNAGPGTVFGIHLAMPGLTVRDPLRSLVWRQQPDAVQFAVHVPKRRSGTVIGTVTVSMDSIPVGRIRFRVSADRAAGELAGPPTGDFAWRFRCVFISYASPDRGEVLRRAQMLKLMGIEFFQDLLHLDPGDRWEQKLYRKIDESDLFLLFWSVAAKKSKWVLREVRYARERSLRSETGSPEIIPVLIGEPPPVPPPRDLAYLHFDDAITYYFAAADGQRTDSVR